jgi:VanZ family protein
MILIFVISTDIGSHRRTSRLIGPLLRWFNPEVSDATIHAVQAVVRKSGHVAGYAILALLLWRGRKMVAGVRPLLSKWDCREACWIVVACALYACTDELHQAFVPTRQGSVLDIVIDTFGAFCGVMLVWLLGRWKRRW